MHIKVLIEKKLYRNFVSEGSESLVNEAQINCLAG
jgi:hypothetical protein